MGQQLGCNCPLQATSGRMQLRLNGLQQHSGAQLGGEAAAVLPPCGLAGMQRTRDRWDGPVDLDAAAAARAEELNRSWVESRGGGGRGLASRALHA